MHPVETLRQADNLIEDERVEDAISLLKQFLNDRDNPHIWWKLARALTIVGEEILARSILRNVILKLPDPHILDIIAARIPVGRPHVFDDLKMIYFSIPKCGSSTIKDAFLISRGEEPRGEISHQHTHPFTKVLAFAEVYSRFSSYHIFTVVRPPRARLRSYWTKNVREAQSLKEEANGKDTFYGLRTVPSYAEVVENFHRYRSVFRDFRHHTDSLIGFTGADISGLSRIYGMSEINEAIAEIADRSKIAIPEIQNMKSERSSFALDTRAEQLEADVISGFYETETQTFFGQEMNP
ncbi:MAG: sulfotransferase family 2 domain-containing protein [Aurantimonas endophytica]|uniref:sulfotransferase family 2 domain-containing protein n=1 Tax=Aurantimonas endophytica TaxID=1522175 RepID=UPI003001E29C